MAAKIKNHWVNFPQKFYFFSFCKNLLLESKLIDISQISISSEQLFMVTPSVLTKQCETACNTFIWLKGLIQWVLGEKERISWIGFIRSHKSWIWLPSYAASSPSTVETLWPCASTATKHTLEGSPCSLCFTY